MVLPHSRSRKDDYHVEVDGHYYSLPYQLVKQQQEVRLTARIVECFHANQRVASHVRSRHTGRHSTQNEHMPKSHRGHAEWPPAPGPATALGLH